MVLLEPSSIRTGRPGRGDVDASEVEEHRVIGSQGLLAAQPGRQVAAFEDRLAAIDSEEIEDRGRQIDEADRLRDPPTGRPAGITPGQRRTSGTRTASSWTSVPCSHGP